MAAPLDLCGRPSAERTGKAVFGALRPCPSLKHWAPQGLAVGPQSIGQDKRIPAIVLGAGEAEAIAEAVKLLGIDRVDLKPVLQ